jgi:hypothetical protein
MTINRRFVLKGVALGSGAGLAMGNSMHELAEAFYVDGSVTLALVDGSTVEPVFLQGALMAAGTRLQVQRSSSDLDFIRGLEREMRAGQPLRVIGLLDDGTATLVVDMARSAGARVQWLGQHSAAGAFVHHRLLTTDVAEYCFMQLGNDLLACGAGFGLREVRINGATAPRQLGATAQHGNHSAQWAASLGYVLASLGTHQPAASRAVSPANLRLTGSFVSFSIEVPGSLSNG